MDSLIRFNMLDSHPSPTPLSTGVRLSREQSPKSDEEKTEMDEVPYKQAVGTLIYLACLIRPDIAHAVHVVSQYMEGYRREH